MVLVKPDFPDERLVGEAAVMEWADRGEGARALPACSPGPGLGHPAGTGR
jgi:hypothetical protein